MRTPRVLDGLQDVAHRRVDQFTVDPSVAHDQHAVAESGGFEIVRDHHDASSLCGVVAQQSQHARAGFGVERAGRLVREEQRRRCRQCAGDGDALLLAAGQLSRPPIRDVSQADGIQCGHHGAPADPTAGQAHGQCHIVERGECRKQVVRLEDESDVLSAERGSRSRSSSPIAVPAIVTSPEETASRPDMHCRSVDLPDPLGPTMVTISPRRTLSETPLSTWTGSERRSPPNERAMSTVSRMVFMCRELSDQEGADCYAVFMISVTGRFVVVLEVDVRQRPELWQ